MTSSMAVIAVTGNTSPKVRFMADMASAGYLVEPPRRRKAPVVFNCLRPSGMKPWTTTPRVNYPRIYTESGTREEWAVLPKVIFHRNLMNEDYKIGIVLKL